MRNKQEWLAELARCVLEMEEETVTAEVAKGYLADGHPALDGILKGLVLGMNRAGELYEQEEYFVSDLLLCSDAMYAGLNELRPYLAEAENGESRVKAVIGVVEGDTHDIGKNLVKIMLETAGFEVHDLGRDVPVETFVARTRELGAQLVCMSTLMSTTMVNMGRVVERLKEEKMRDSVRIIIGGGPISPAFAKKIGADAYSSTAVDAVVVARQLAATL